MGPSSDHSNTNFIENEPIEQTIQTINISEPPTIDGIIRVGFILLKKYIN